MTLPKFLEPCFPSYDIKNLNKTKHKKLIITEILNFGTEKDREWLFKTYSERQIKEVLKRPLRGMWLKSILDNWLNYFNIKIPKFNYELAILNLDPKPDLAEKFFREVERKNTKYHQRLKTLGLNSF